MNARISVAHINLPGHRAPTAGFDTPFEMLSACHERVARTLALLSRLRHHVVTAGCDAAAADAARDVLRYFDVAAPLHHDDEELHVFPPLLAGHDEALHAVVRRLQQGHVDMASAWGEARLAILRVRDADLPSESFAFSAGEDHALTHFSGLYERHIHDEETLVYPAARGRFDADSLRTMAEDMKTRRSI